ncbi:MAG: S1 family peptidase [Minisyncoccota bacterium]
MLRFAPYLGIVAALALWALVIILFGRTVASPAPESSTVPSTLSVVSGITAPSPAPATPLSKAPTKITAISSQKKESTSPVTSTIAAQPVSINPPPTAPSSGNALLDASASTLRAALVNIICLVPAGSGLHSISGSGVIVDSKGIILTNAHVAQYFLLADRGVSCTIRSGSPAADSYDATLVFISPAWIKANASVLTQTAPIGTGQYDFALLAITKSATSATLPSSFQSIPLAIVPPQINTSVIIASYGAQFLDSNQVQSALFPTVVFGSVKNVFTFATNTVDVLALGGSAAAQEGSSGGGVADASGNLIGTITTSTVSGDTSTRSLSAITASYIRADYASETGNALDVLLNEPTATAVAAFAPQIPALESAITAYLQ